MYIGPYLPNLIFSLSQQPRYKKTFRAHQASFPGTDAAIVAYQYIHAAHNEHTYMILLYALLLVPGALAC